MRPRAPPCASVRLRAPPCASVRLRAPPCASVRLRAPPYASVRLRAPPCASVCARCLCACARATEGGEGVREGLAHSFQQQPLFDEERKGPCATERGVGAANAFVRRALTDNSPALARLRVFHVCTLYLRAATAAAPLLCLLLCTHSTHRTHRTHRTHSTHRTRSTHTPQQNRNHSRKPYRGQHAWR